MTTRDRLQLLPDLPPEQYDALKADIAERGVVVAIDVDEFEQILDGHHRARATTILLVIRSGLTEEQKRTFSRKANELRRQLSRERSGT